MPKKRKKPGTRYFEKRLFILCEGKADKSESAYFKSLIKSCRLAGKRVEVTVVDTDKNTGRELAKEAKKIKEFPNDIVWIVYDKNGYTKHPETFNIAKQNGISIGFSSISFEYWILLHYEFTSRSFNKSEDIIKYLKNKNYINYEKGSINIYSQTKNLLQTAILNAIKIQKYQISGNPNGTPIYDLNPYTNLNELIEKIKKFEIN